MNSRQNMGADTVLITGAARGIGLALAHQFAHNGHGMVLTSRSESELERVASRINRQYGVNVGIIAQDLENPGAPEEIFAAMTRSGVKIDILVNNAGLGYRGQFWNIALEKQIPIVRVNIEATVRLTHLFLPEMLSRAHGRILNTASVAGFEPGPLLAVYHASKAFVLSFSEALATELQDSGVTVTALCPGPTDTDFFPKAGMLETRAFQQTKVMSPQEVARIGYQAVMNQKRTVVAGGANRALVFARRFMSEGAQARMNAMFYEDARPEARKRHRGDLEKADAVPY